MNCDIWKQEFNWMLSGNTWIQVPMTYIPETLNINNMYWRFQTYLSGMCYNYIDSLQNPYDISIMTGDGYSLYNMYNEFDMVDTFLKNLNHVDIAIDYNLDLTKNYFTLDNIRLKHGHKLLLFNQNDPTENDIYVIGKKNYLYNSGDLATSDLSFRYKCVVRNGTYTDKQFFLVNDSQFTFPISGDAKQFEKLHSYLLKNEINYDYKNTDLNYPCKVIFTDYDIARKLNNENATLYSGFTMEFNNDSRLPLENDVFNINYKNAIDYNIYVITGSTTYIAWANLSSTVMNVSGETLIKFSDVIVNVGDYIEFKIWDGLIPSIIIVDLKTFVKDINGDMITLKDTIPPYVFNIIDGGSGYRYAISTLQYLCNASDTWVDRLEKCYISKYYDITNPLHFDLWMDIVPKQFHNNLYFDYDGLSFNYISGGGTTAYTFTTDNQYISYKLYDQLVRINPIEFYSTYNIYNNFILNSFSWIPGNTYIEIDATNPSDLTNFIPYTFVKLSGSTDSGYTLIYSITDSKMLIETPLNTNVTASTFYIQNVYQLEEISDLLYYTYKNQNYLYFRQRSDNARQKICDTYGEIISKDSSIQYNCSGSINRNSKEKFEFRLFQPVFSYSGNTYNIDDASIFYQPVEIVDIGVDKKTKMPIPITLSGNSIYTPNMFGSLVLWLVPDSTSGLTNVWLDQTTYHNDASGVTGAVGPVWFDNTANGHDGPFFDYLSASTLTADDTISLKFTNGYTILVVAFPICSGVTDYILRKTDILIEPGWLIEYNYPTNQLYYKHVSNSGIPPKQNICVTDCYGDWDFNFYNWNIDFNLIDSQPIPSIVDFSGNTAIPMIIGARFIEGYGSDLFLNGFLKTTVSSTKSGCTSNNIDLTIGSFFSEFFDGFIFEILAFNDSLTDTDVHSLFNYLNSKYQIY